MRSASVSNSLTGSALLPAEEVTEWLALDFEKSHIEINPGAAVTGTP